MLWLLITDIPILYLSRVTCSPCVYKICDLAIEHLFLSFVGSAGDSFSYHNGAAFSTKDSDNDLFDSGNCASVYKGSWWFKNCHQSDLNGLYHHGAHNSFADGVNWQTWKNYYYSLKSTSMKVRPLGFGQKK